MIKSVFSSVFLLSNLFLMSSEQTDLSLNDRSISTATFTIARSVPIPKCPPYNSQSDSTLYVPIPECPIIESNINIEDSEETTSQLNKKSYTCNTCGKKFSDISNFKTHKRIHTGVRPYQCDTCSKSFSDISNFKRHKRIHNG